MLKIYGLQKMTLLDYPGHVACTVFLNACNFRCPYCHNFELVTGDAPPVMETEELYAFLFLSPIISFQFCQVFFIVIF